MIQRESKQLSSNNRQVEYLLLLRTCQTRPHWKRRSYKVEQRSKNWIPKTKKGARVFFKAAGSMLKRLQSGFLNLKGKGAGRATRHGASGVTVQLKLTKVPSGNICRVKSTKSTRRTLIKPRWQWMFVCTFVPLSDNL